MYVDIHPTPTTHHYANVHTVMACPTHNWHSPYVVSIPTSPTSIPAFTAAPTTPPTINRSPHTTIPPTMIASQPLQCTANDCKQKRTFFIPVRPSCHSTPTTLSNQLHALLQQACVHPYGAQKRCTVQTYRKTYGITHPYSTPAPTTSVKNVGVRTVVPVPALP